MPDAQFPTDGDDGNGNQPRRAGLRLRDAEAVATTRRDMFGDGSLLDTLAGAAPADPEGEEPRSALAASLESQPSSSPEPLSDLLSAGAEGAEAPAAAIELARAEGHAEAVEPLQAEQPAQAVEPAQAEGPAEALEASQPEGTAEAGEPAHAEGAARAEGAGETVEPAQVAGSVEAEVPAEPAEAAPAAESAQAEQPALVVEPAEHAEAEADFSEPEVPHFPNPASSPFSQIPQSLDSIIDSFGAEPAAEQGAPPGATPDPAELPPEPQLDPLGVGSHPDGTAIVTPLRPMAVSSIFDSLGPAGTSAEAARPMDEDLPPEVAGLDMSMLGGPLPQGVPSREARPDVEPPIYAEAGVEAATDAAEEVDSPPQDSTAVVSDPLPAEASAPVEGAEGPPSPDMPTPFPAYSDPAPPAYPEPAPPTYPEPAIPARDPGSPVLPSFPELSARVSPERFEPAQASEHRDAPAPPSYPEPIESVAAPAEASESAGYDSYEPLARSSFPEAGAAQSRLDAAAKIAAEASATADALDNLNHLLGQREQRGAEPPARPRAGAGSAQSNLLGDPAQFTLGQRVPLMPLPVAPDAEQGKGIYLLGFLTGLGLSLMAGVALYFLIATG